MISFPNAKINIGLDVIEKRPDNFHNIDTVLYPVDIKDILEIIEAQDDNGSVRFTSSGLPIDADAGNNLCVEAYRLLCGDHNLPPVCIHLHKVIPVGAGLGGGSADAAFTIKMLNKLFSLNITEQGMVEYAKRLGSDCAFFINNHPARATGRGDILEPVETDIAGYILVLVYPGIFISTAEAYSSVTPEKPQQLLKDLVMQPLKQWKGTVHNSFETTIFTKYPELREIKEKLYGLGALYSSLSGSGSAVYGIFDKQVDTDKVFSGYKVWQTVI